MTKLTDLLIDEDAFDEEKLASALKDRVALTPVGGIRPLEQWDELTEEGKIVVCLLAIRALHILGRRPAADANAADIVALAGTAIGTVKPGLRGLVKSRIVDQTERGRYTITTTRVSKAVTALTGMTRKSKSRNAK